MTPPPPPLESDHQTATRRQCEQVMDFQLKMKEACQKFESLEEEHLAQMSTFVIKIAKASDILFSIESCSIYTGGWLPV